MPAVLPRSRLLERLTRATRLPVLAVVAQPALGARNLALSVAPERPTKGPERLHLRFALTAMPDRLTLFDAAGGISDPEQLAP